jgi:hypothetical protein
MGLRLVDPEEEIVISSFRKSSPKICAFFYMSLLNDAGYDEDIDALLDRIERSNSKHTPKEFNRLPRLEISPRNDKQKEASDSGTVSSRFMTEINLSSRPFTEKQSVESARSPSRNASAPTVELRIGEVKASVNEIVPTLITELNQVKGLIAPIIPKIEEMHKSYVYKINSIEFRYIDLVCNRIKKRS